MNWISGDGPGNIAKAINDEFKLDLSLPLDRAGLADGLFKISGLWDDSRLKDPVTGVTRPISNVRDRDITFTYQQDIRAWNSSLTLAFNPAAWSQPTYRIAQISEVRLLTPYLELDWDYKPRPDLDIQVQADNFIPYHIEIEQDNYGGPRNLSPLSQVLDVHNVSEPRLYLQLRKSF